MFSRLFLYKYGKSMPYFDDNLSELFVLDVTNGVKNLVICKAYLIEVYLVFCCFHARLHPSIIGPLTYGPV